MLHSLFFVFLPFCSKWLEQFISLSSNLLLLFWVLKTHISIYVYQTEANEAKEIETKSRLLKGIPSKKKTIYMFYNVSQLTIMFASGAFLTQLQMYNLLPALYCVC